MSQPLITHREDENKSPGRAISFVFPAILFLGGMALFTIAFNYDWGAWLFVGGIALIGLAFAIPTTILPALEDRE
ncbi:hypothetical protein [Cellulomonas sp. URHE0023]|uniref:hypothetical protein n=1 Tax=Cellulomonas sp. URHE0023 TaxID=1380354 RepID=UPI0004847247|nr:hypothetical protein [Cellulomonas sp. URHE0023]